MHGWEFWIDRGGTFTDVIGRSPEGRLHVRKRLSAPGADGVDPGLAAAREILAAHADPDARVDAFKVGTTVATNALLERAGEPVVLVTTRGLGDALAIGHQARPDVFALAIELSAPLYAEVIEARERIGADGATVTPLDEAALEQALREAYARGRRACAITFLHGWRYTSHEAAAARIARACGYTTVSASHEVSPLPRFVPRGESAVFDAYLDPPLARYRDALERDVTALDARCRLYFMQSSGGLVEAARFRARSSVLSGPAGGLTAMAKLAAPLGIDALIGFDMGGTSTDVSLYDGVLPRRFEHEIAGTRIRTPMLDIHTIAAGGGSILEYRDERLQVGPESAGASPGPAAYGRGGPATVTDIQVVLGRLQPSFLPHAFGANGRDPIDPSLARAAFAHQAAALARDGQPPRTIEELAGAWLDVAIESMANAVRQVAGTAGRDPAEFTLFCFGGAAPQHACRVAAACGGRRVVVHPLASVLSAFGIGTADWLEVRREGVREPLDAASLAAAAETFERLEADARDALAAVGFDETSIAITRTLELRAGTSETSLDVPFGAARDVRAAFDNAHRRRYGYASGDAALTLETLRLEGAGLRLFGYSSSPPPQSGTALPPAVDAWFDGAWRSTPVVAVDALERAIDGPALLVATHFTIVVEPGWRAERRAGGEIVLEALAPHRPAPDIATSDPARLEIFNNLYMHIATRMGDALRETAQSVNIRERLDYSCAVFDADGRLVANAPHMPVHLGSMGASVRAVIETHGARARPGDAWMLNSPYSGGTHLPDITVVSPVFLGADRADAWVASRAHHADIGGVTPGSMPPSSTTIDEEGVLFSDFALFEEGALRRTALRTALTAGPWPARNPERNIADIEAQLAANARGAQELERAVARYGRDAVRTYFAHVQANADECVRRAITRLRSGSRTVELDGGQRIVVSVAIDSERRTARIDFGGTSAAGAHNFNAPRAICIAAVLYVFRTLLDRPIPLNEGCLAPLEIVVPADSMLAPAAPAAVVAGNVETSQCIVDALYGALGVLAASQGTMNNLTFGTERLQYYETIAGGAGAGAGFDGADAVQTHMTNSRLTDIEILEAAYPVRVREFSIRRGSGGTGATRGGDGIVRAIEFLEPMSGAMLANRRRTRPFGLAGGGDGAPGITRLSRADGTHETLAATAHFELRPGDTLVIETPGGGGYGDPATPLTTR